jgi:SAM-dependent methyltransferase
MTSIPGGWDRADVAAAQRDLVIGELCANDTLPFMAFIDAMNSMKFRAGKLLDVGCGVGHYGVLCERNFPAIRYRGTDASRAMIDEARILAPLCLFDVCEFYENKFADYDIVLASQVVEMDGDSWDRLCLLLSSAKRYVILNRIRLTPEKSHRITEATYCGHTGYNWLWNMAEIEAEIAHHGSVVYKDVYANGGQAIYVVEV